MRKEGKRSISGFGPRAPPWPSVSVLRPFAHSKSRNKTGAPRSGLSSGAEAEDGRSPGRPAARRRRTGRWGQKRRETSGFSDRGVIVCHCCGGSDGSRWGNSVRTRGEGKARAAKAPEGAPCTRTAAGTQAEGLTGFVSDEKMIKFHAFHKTRKALVYRGEAVVCGRGSLRGVPRPRQVPGEKTPSSAQKSCRGQ